ncbi:DUF1080 domain-containing protein [Pseudoflavonifractor sp. BIOML-A16]|nr:DUF1080 domain-containing protein [Pseudoflavonifractor sp. BIOML-A16]
MKKVCSLLLAFAMLLSFIPSNVRATGTEETAWDILDADTVDYTQAFKLSEAGTASSGVLTQMEGYVNILKGDDKPNNVTSGAYTWLVPKDGVTFPEGVFTVEVSARAAGPVDGRANEISARVDMVLYPIFLRYGGEGEGCISSQHDYSEEDSYVLDTTIWHNYGLVVDRDSETYDVYVDGELVLEGKPGWANNKTGDLLRMGVDNNSRGDLDIQSVRVGSGDASGALSAYDGPAYEQIKLLGVELSSYRQMEGAAATVTAAVTGRNCPDGTEVTLTLLDRDHAPVEGVTAYGALTGNAAELTLEIPDTLGPGAYYVQAEAECGSVRSDVYTVDADREDPDFPSFAAVGYTIERADYQYDPTEEFNFPCVVDTRDHPVENAFGSYRYYLFYAPHNAPAGLCVAGSDSLNGSWTEYGGNPVISNDWKPNYSVNHVSSPHVIWNDTEGLWFMYFHGENAVTRYATSDDLINWTYGGVCVKATDFSPAGTDCSYARVFEYEVPGLGNKYIMTTMLHETVNRIFWAYSNDGRTWEPVETPLVDPTGTSEYKGNLSGAWFMRWEDRNFIICHATSGNMYAFEVGDTLDECVPWGVFYESQGTRDVDELNPAAYPDFGRAGAPCLVQDDNGRWHMFYEGGKRLHANIVHAVEVQAGEEDQLARAGLELAEKEAVLTAGGTAAPVLHLFDKKNSQLATDAEGLTLKFRVSNPEVIRFEDGTITALGAGTATAWVEAELDGVSAVSSKVEVTVVAAESDWDLLDASMGDYTASYTVSKSGNSAGTVTQEDGHIHITNTAANYCYLVPQSMSALSGRGVITAEAAIRLPVAVDGVRANEFALRLNSVKTGFPIFLKYGTKEDGGGVTYDSTYGDPASFYAVDTTQWHNYGLVIDPSKIKVEGSKSKVYYAIYVDGEKVLETYSGWVEDKSDLIRVGSATGFTCSMDVESIRVGSGDLADQLGKYPLPENAAPDFPKFAAVGYTIDMTDYQYNPTQEFNFPTIVDTKGHKVDNALTKKYGKDFRYYLFYAPHDAPAGNCVAASDSLDGPWVEYEKNPVVANVWPKDDGSGENWYKVSHVSSPQVVWVDEQDCYVMYYHGENSTTRYATSDDLLNWTYGGVCVEAKDFNTSDMTYHQASYAKVFPHEGQVQGESYQYIMLMMVTHNISSGSYHSNIGWAHSSDGINWTAVKTPLVNPDLDPDVYGTNLSGPWFMELDGRYFVICHASSGEIYAFEVGKNLDECIEWGVFYSSQGIRNVDDANPECYPDYGRAGAASFIRDDDGRWHMFYEAGKRLNTNSVHAVEVQPGEEHGLARIGLELEETALTVGGAASPVLRLFDKSNEKMSAEGVNLTCHVSDESVIRYADGTITALKAGTATAWVEAALDGVTVLSPKVRVQVTEAGGWGLLNETAEDYTKGFRSIGGNTPASGTLLQKVGYVNILKGDDKGYGDGSYNWLASPDKLDLPSGTFSIEASIRLAGPVSGERANEFSARTGGMLYHLYLKYGKEDGGVAIKTNFADLYQVDTTTWHNYGLVVDPASKTYTVYVDGREVMKHTSTWTLSGADIIRLGADSKGRCNMDVQSVRAGTGDLHELMGPYTGSVGEGPELTKVSLSASGQKEDEAKTVTVTVAGENFDDNTAVTVKLVDVDNNPVENVTAAGTFTDNAASIALPIPAGLTVGTYYVTAQAGESTLRSEAYKVTTAQDAPVFPTFAATGYTVDMADYKYNPTQEFNFPTIVDTKAHPVKNALGDNAYRYYLFYAPHNNPGGNCVAVSNSLEGPWTEYGNNPVVKNEWEPNYKVGHISSPHVMWHEESGKYIMYYHGENPTTRYALSDDLINWEYGGVCVTANQFSTTGSGFSEASYARIYEHTVPGLDNKYIMLLMITGSGNNMHRNIYWAHSKDGIEWTPVQEPLLNPDINPVYKSNFSGPFFMPWEVDGELRYFVICHASSGEMYAFEVGEKLDQCIEWGEVYNSQGVRNVDDANPECYPDYGRSGAPFFIQDDEGRWHMFYEAGKRLNTNIVHAVEVKDGEESELARAGLELENTTLLADGTARPVLHLFDKSNGVVPANTEGLNLTYHVSDESVIQYENGVITALKEGKATAWVVAKLGDVEVASSKAAVTVAAPSKEVIITNADTPNKTALNLELPAVFKAEGVLDKPIDNYYLYFSYTDEAGGTKSIALATAPAPEGPWTVYQNGTPVMTKESLGVSGTVNAPWPIWDKENGRMLMYYSMGTGAIGVAESTDGVTFTNPKTVFEAKNAPAGNQAYQQSVYEYTIPGKNNKYLMLYTGNGFKETDVTTNGKQIFCAWSVDGLTWTPDDKVLVYPDSGDKGNIASPRLLVKDGEPYVVYHNSNGNIGWSKLSADFSTFTRAGRYYNSIDNGEPDRGRAAAAAFLEEGGVLYMYYTARSNKAKNAADASVLVCRSMGDAQGVLFRDDFNDGSADGWEPVSGEWSVVDGAYVQSNIKDGHQTFAGDMSWTDYEFEVKVTPADTSKNIAVMLNGRAKDANDRYIGSYNNGTLSINCRISGKDKDGKALVSKPYAMELGAAYTMKMVFRGDQIELWINGVKELEVRDDTYSAGRIGLVTFNTSAKFDDVVVRTVSGEPQPAGPIAVKDFGDHQVIQRDVETGSAAVAVSGTVGVDAAKVEVCVTEFEGGEVVKDWTTVAENAAAGAAWSGSITLPQGGWYRLRARALDGAGKVLGEAEGAHKWGVGINILCIGQSNMVGQAPERPCTAADDLVANYTRSGNWTHLTDPYDGAGGSLVPSMGNALVAELGIPVGFIPAADSGSGLHAPNPYTNPPHGPTRYWMYYTTPDDTSTLYGKAVTRAKAAGGVELAVWNQGETDGAISVAKETYESDMKTLLSRLRKDLDNPELPIFLCQIGTHNPNISDDAAYTAIRSAQHDLDDGENFFLAATEMEFARKDTAHYRKAGMDEIGRRVANSVLFYYGESDYYRGPYISGASYADDSRKVIDVRITHRGGTDITPAAGNIPGFSVLDNANEVAVASAVRLNATTVRLTLESAVAGSGQVRYLYGLNPYPDTDVSGNPKTSDLQKDAIVVKDNTALALPLENTTDPVLVDGDKPPVVDPPEEERWDLMDHAMGPDWKADGWRSSSKTGSFNQNADYVNIQKPNGSGIGSEKLYHWACSPATLRLPRDGFTLQVRARAAGEVDNAANEIGVRMGLNSEDTNGQLASIFLGYGKDGFVSSSATGTGRYVMKLDTTVWHDYSLVVRQENGAYFFDLYVDDALAFENAPLATYKGGDLIRLGADNGGRCNLDVQTVRLGSGEVLPEGVSPARVTGVSLSAQSQKENEVKSVTVTVTGRDFADGAQVEITLVDRNDNTVAGVSAGAVFTDNTAAAALSIPAGLSATTYYVKAQANGRVRYSAAYTVEADRPAPSFPQFTPDGYTIELEDYKYNPTQEFNFPTIVDTKDHPVENALGDYRYYLFYAPHDAPAGNCVAVSNSLDGPWVEYGSNPVVSKEWDENYSVSHVSSPFVMWNDVYDCYFMYFHGENNITRYATSDDLLSWTYGGVCVTANDFSPTGGGLNEASYAKVFEHEVPGLGNKYIMLLMVTGTATGGHRNIYWAHSEDGKTWTAVQNALLDPTMDSEYKGNFSGPWFMPREVDGELRYFVICHASSGNMYAFEVGERLDECIPWGVVYDSVDSPDPDDPDHDGAWPDYGRAGAPSFIQDDDGGWHMFYEGGKRLHANIVHATAPADSVYVPPASSVTTKSETLPDGTKVTTRTDRATGTVTVTTLSPDGTKTVAVTRKNGSGTEVLTRPDGVRADSKIDRDGGVTASVTLPDAVERTTVEIPAGSGNVVILVNEDGTERALTLFTVENGRARVLLDGSARLRVEECRAGFTDTEGAVAEAAAALAARGVFQGTGADTFSPALSVDRATIVTLLHRIDGGTPAESAPGFADVPENAWYAAGVAWAGESGVTLGVGGGNFAPGMVLTWQQVSVMLYRYAALTGAAETVEGGEIEAALAWCAEHGVGAGAEAGEAVSRGELALTLYQYIKALVG